MSRVVRKWAFAYAKTKTQISFAVTAKLISAFVFATRRVQFLFYLNLKFQASSHLLWLYSPVCVGPGRKPRRPVFSQRGSYIHDPTCSKVFHLHCKHTVLIFVLKFDGNYFSEFAYAICSFLGITLTPGKIPWPSFIKLFCRRT